MTRQKENASENGTRTRTCLQIKNQLQPCPLSSLVLHCFSFLFASASSSLRLPLRLSFLFVCMTFPLLHHVFSFLHCILSFIVPLLLHCLFEKMRCELAHLSTTHRRKAARRRKSRCEIHRFHSYIDCRAARNRKNAPKAHAHTHTHTPRRQQDCTASSGDTKASQQQATMTQAFSARGSQLGWPVICRQSFRHMSTRLSARQRRGCRSSASNTVDGR